MADKKGPKTHEPKSVTPTAADIARGLGKATRGPVKGARHKPLGETEASTPARSEPRAADNVGTSLSAPTGLWEMFAEERFTNMETRLQSRYELGLSDLHREIEGVQSQFRTEVEKEIHSGQLGVVLWVAGIVVAALVSIFVLLYQMVMPLGERVRELEVRATQGTSVEWDSSLQRETTPGSP
jgi:hypothetical protein